MTAFLTGMAFGWFLEQEVAPILWGAIKERFRWHKPKITIPKWKLSFNQKIRRLKAKAKIWIMKKN